MNPKIGIVTSAHRPKNWMDFYRSLGKNDIEFELVFVGPNPPDYELPKNFRFIKSLVKPAQCVEIAVRNTTADLILDVADDCEFHGSRPLDRLYQKYRACNDDKIILSCRYMLDGVDISDCCTRCFFTGKEDGLAMPICGLMSRKFYHDLGGIDKNFEAAYWSLDIALRVYELGGSVVVSDVYINEDKNKSEGSTSISESAVHDRALLDNLWTTDGKFSLKRKNLVESFSDTDILIASQGPRGRWRGKGLALFEKIEDNLIGQWTPSGRIIRAIRQPSRYLYYLKKMVAKLAGML